ncbi:MAG: spore germination protein [Clostridia bacterium]|nr:spore germination protein [Clostridia bacterium]
MEAPNTVLGDPVADLGTFKNIFAEDAAFRFREICSPEGRVRAGICFFDGMASGSLVAESIAEPVASFVCDGKELRAEQVFSVVTNCELKREDSVEKLISAVMYGDTLLFVPGGAFAVGTKNWLKRTLTEPRGETVIRGPREGFIESALDNVSMIRRRLKTRELRVEMVSLGEKANNFIYICSIRGVADEKVRCELKRRIAAMTMTDILESNYIAEQIRDCPHSPFKTVGTTERPDSVAAKLLEGRVAVVVDGSPCVLTVPYLFVENFQSGEDYYTGNIFSSVNRAVRFVGTALSACIPAFYIAIVNYHQEMLPTVLLLSISKARQGVPFPTILELLLLLAAFDILREASLRMSNNIGQALSVVGALIIGQSAVEAKFVSAPVVIIVALTGTTSMLASPMMGALVCVRSFLLAMTAAFGLTGFTVGLVLLGAYLCSLSSFGVPYLSFELLPDGLIRRRWGKLRYRKLFGAGRRDGK